MRNLFYAILIIILVSWAIGFIGYNAGALIHLLLVIAVILVIIGIIKRGVSSK
jgi:hypothetical protein